MFVHLIGMLLVFPPPSGLPQVPRIGGLRAGEVVRHIDPPAPAEGGVEDGIIGRLVEAESGLPLSGARIETWSEDYFDPERMPPPLEVAESGRDGVFVVRREGVEKIRITHPERASTVVVASDVDGEEFPLFPRRPLSLRVTDLDGRPLDRAWGRTRQTCAHAPPADFARAGPDGVLRLEAAPPLADLASIEVGAPGYGAVDGLWPSDLLRFAARDGVADVPLPRRAPIEVAVRDAAGGPARGRLLYGEHPWRVAWLGPGGLGTIDDPSSNREGPRLALLGPAGMKTQAWLPSYFLPRDRPAVLGVHGTFDATKWEGPTTEVTVELAPAVATGAPPPVWLYDEHGFVEAGLGPHVLPRGEITVVAGGAFTGWREAVVSVVATGPALRIRPATAPEPRVEIVPPPRGLERVVVQAGGDAVVLSKLERPTVQSVPAGVAVTILGVGRNGELRRARLAEATAGTRVDLSRDETVVRRALDPEAWPEVNLWIDAVDRQGQPVAARIGRLMTVAGAPPESELTGTGAVRARVPGNARWAAEVLAEGYAPRWLLDTTGSEDQARTATLDRLARVALKGNFARAVVGPHVVRPNGVAVSVSPGPLDVKVELPDATWLAVQLELEPGDTRTVEIP